MRVGLPIHWLVILRLMLLCIGFASAGPAWAARVAVVLSSDTPPYQEVYQVIRAMLGDAGHEAVRHYADRWGGVSTDARLVITVGTYAAEAVAGSSSRLPVLAVLVPRAWFMQTGHNLLSDGGRRQVSAIYLDQPYARQARLIRLALPEVRRVGVLISSAERGVLEEIDAALRSQDLQLVHALLNPGARLAFPLETVLADSDMLLAIPDPAVFNSATAQSLLLTSYRYRDPVMGYSRSLTRAGALFSLHSSPAQIARQSAEIVLEALRSPGLRLSSPAYPQYFDISINEQVARSLGFSVPPAVELERSLRGDR